MEQWFIDIRQQETWDPVSSEKANKWMNHMITWREFPCSVQGCVCVSERVCVSVCEDVCVSVHVRVYSIL